MAEMIPESITASKEATPGEKRVFRCLRDALLPDEDYIVWFEPKSIKRRPDFLVWSQELGLLVIEVKDWTTSTIVEANLERWTLRHNYANTVHQSPLEQARECFVHFKELLQQSPELLHTNGAYKGNLKFPIGYCAAFTQITRMQAEQTGVARALGSAECLFSDDLFNDFDSRDAQRAFRSKLGRAFPVKFTFNPLTAGELKLLRYLIFPEVRIHGVRSNSACALRTPRQAEMIRALDLEQERTAKSILEGHRVLKGVAGSGKTLVVACRAKYLRKMQPEWRILIVCYNIALCRYIHQLLSATETESTEQGIDVYHYHGLVKALTGANLGKLDETQDVWDARVGTILREEIASGRLTQRYDAILIDEGQDFAVEWLQSLTELLNETSDSLLFCLDPAQNIFGRKVSYRSVGMKVQGKRPTMLNRSYRNTVEILHLARTFSRVLETKHNSEEDFAIEGELFPVDMDRHGVPPLMFYDKPPAEQIEFILNVIDEATKSGDYSWCDIAVLYAAPHFAGTFAAIFNHRFGEERISWISRSRGSKVSLDLSSPTVKLCTIESAKGLEFRLVFLMGLETLPRIGRVEADERKLAYVGLTRAQDLLYMLGSEKTGLLKELSEMLVTDGSN